MTFRKSNQISTLQALKQARKKVRQGEFIPAIHCDDRGRHVAHVHKYGSDGQPARPVAKIIVDQRGRRTVRKDH